jgi:hypothetical protein
LKRTWRAVWHYRALWIFGVVIALTTFSWGPWWLWGGHDEQKDPQGIVITRGDDETFAQAFRRTMRQEIDRSNRELNTVLAEELHTDVRVDLRVILPALFGIGVIIYVAGKIARYVSEIALIRMVDQYGDKEARHSVWQGLRMGWSRAAWQLFFVDLLFFVFAVSAGTAIFTMVFGHLPLWVNAGEAVIFVMAFLTTGLFFVGIAVTIVVVSALSAVKRLAHQACVVEELGVFASIGRSVAVVWQRRRDVVSVWLVTVGVKLAWPAIVIPFVLVLLGIASASGGVLGVLMSGLASLAWAGDVPVFVGIAAGLAVFFFVLIAPLVTLDGVREVFLSGLWTLSYRELRSAGTQVEAQPAPGLDPGGLSAAPAV